MVGYNGLQEMAIWEIAMKHDRLAEIVWKNIDILLKANKVKLKQLSDSLFIPDGDFRRMRNRKQIDLYVISKIASFFDVSIYYLMEDRSVVPSSSEVDDGFENIWDDSKISDSTFISDEEYEYFIHRLTISLPQSERTPQYIRRDTRQLLKDVLRFNPDKQGAHSIGVPGFDDDGRVKSAIDKLIGCSYDDADLVKENVETIICVAKENEIYGEPLYIGAGLSFVLPDKKDIEQLGIEAIGQQITKEIQGRLIEKQVVDDIWETSNIGAGCTPETLIDPWEEAKKKVSERRKKAHDERKSARQVGVSTIKDGKRGRPTNKEIEEVMEEYPWHRDDSSATDNNDDWF